MFVKRRSLCWAIGCVATALGIAVLWTKVPSRSPVATVDIATSVLWNPDSVVASFLESGEPVYVANRNAGDGNGVHEIHIMSHPKYSNTWRGTFNSPNVGVGDVKGRYPWLIINDFDSLTGIDLNSHQPIWSRKIGHIFHLSVGESEDVVVSLETVAPNDGESERVQVVSRYLRSGVVRDSFVVPYAISYSWPSAFAVDHVNQRAAIVVLGKIRIHAIRSGKVLATIAITNPERPRHATFSSDGNLLCVSGTSGWTVWNVEEERTIAEHRSEEKVADSESPLRYRMEFPRHSSTLLVGTVGEHHNRMPDKPRQLLKYDLSTQELTVIRAPIDFSAAEWNRLGNSVLLVNLSGIYLFDYRGGGELQNAVRTPLVPKASCDAKVIVQ